MWHGLWLKRWHVSPAFFAPSHNHFPLSVEWNKILLHDNVITTHHLFYSTSFVPVARFPRCVHVPHVMLHCDDWACFLIFYSHVRAHITRHSSAYVGDMTNDSLSSANQHDKKKLFSFSVFFFCYFFRLTFDFSRLAFSHSKYAIEWMVILVLSAR